MADTENNTGAEITTSGGAAAETAPLKGEQTATTTAAKDGKKDWAKGDKHVEALIEKCNVSTRNQIIASSVLGVSAILYGVFFIYLGVYGYGNPDPEHAYFIDGVDQTALTKEAAEELASTAGVTVRAGYPIDMAHLFRTWFLWGFWGSVFMIALLATVTTLYIMCKQHLGMIKMIGGISYAVLFCNTAAWFLLGFFWRFSKAGRISSGDKIERPDSTTDNKEWNDFLKAQSEADGYQLKGGHFMSVFLWLCIITFLVVVAGGSIIAALMCMVSSGETGPKPINTAEPATDADTADKKTTGGAEETEQKVQEPIV